MEKKETNLLDCYVLTPDLYGDDRGLFFLHTTRKKNCVRARIWRSCSSKQIKRVAKE